MRTPRLPTAVPLLLVLGCGPIGPLPGGALSGTPTPAPPDWHFTDAVETVQIETRPGDPYSVNVWGIAHERAFFVAAGGGAESTWVTHLEADPRLRLRVEGRLFELHAVRVDEAATRAAVLQALTDKYDFQPDPADAASALLYRLDPRP